MEYASTIEGDVRKFRSDQNYNFDINTKTGYFERWGDTKDQDAEVSPFGPEILDLEISTSVQPKDQERLKHFLTSHGACKGNCAFCYKSNSNKLPTYNMKFEEFRHIFDSMPGTLYSIAFGIMNFDTNPDFIGMAQYARENGVMPTFTMHGLDDITDYRVETISNLFGAVAVSVYDKEKTYDWIKALTDAGMEQVNIHFFLSQETLGKAYEVMDDIANDPRLEKLNAIVFLHNKSKGNSKKNGFNPVSHKDYTKLIDDCFEQNVRFGMDSCGANRVISSINGRKERHLAKVEKHKEEIPNVDLLKNAIESHYQTIIQSCEPCESSLFSSYINAEGQFFPCSFMEGEGKWKIGIDTLEHDNFVDVWKNERVEEWRKTLLCTGRNCPQFKV